MTCAPSEASDQPCHLPSLIRVFAVRMKKHWALNYLLSAQWRLIRLGGCPGWSESSLGARHFVGFVVLRLICILMILNVWANNANPAQPVFSRAVWSRSSLFAICVCIFLDTLLYEPYHEKTCLCHMRTTKVQISLRISAVWSAPLLLTPWKVWYLYLL